MNYMNYPPTAPERRRLLELAREYRTAGYEVIVAPEAGQLPDFVAPYYPDMIAWNQQETVVFAVKSQKTLAASPELPAIAEAVHGRTGWRFELVVTNPRERATFVTATEQLLSPAEIQRRLREADFLAEQEAGEAAFLLAWSATEAVVRTLAVRERVAGEKDAFEFIVKNLFAHGILERSHYETLTEAVKVRNTLVHGYKEPQALATLLHRVIAVTGHLLNETAGARL